MRLEITDFAIVTPDYLSNLCDPIFGVWLEMSCVRILLGRHDQDAGRGRDCGSICRVCSLKGRPYSSPTENSCSLPSASSTVCVCESGHVTAISGEVALPMTDLTVSETVNSLSTRAPRSGCFCLRVARFLGSPNDRRLRRVLVVLVVIVGSYRGRRTPRLTPPLYLQSDSRQLHVPYQGVRSSRPPGDAQLSEP